MSNNKDWNEVKLGDVTFEQKARLGSQYSFSEMPVYGVDNDIGITPTSKYSSNDLSRYKIVNPGMFAYNPMRLNIGSIGLCNRGCQPGLVSSDYIVFGCHEDLLIPEYLELLIEGAEWSSWVTGAGTGSVRTRIYYCELARLPLYLPPVSEQIKILSTVKPLNRQVTLGSEINRTIDSIAQKIFTSWFVDFDPVKMKARERKPSGMDDETAALFPDSFKDSEMGEIPKGWRVGKMEDIANITSGKRPLEVSTQSDPENKIPVYGGGGIMGYTSNALFNVPILATGRVGTLGQVHRIFKASWPSDNALVITSIDESFYDYIYFNMCRINYTSLNRGSTQPLVTQTDLKNVDVLIPNEEIVRIFHKAIAPMFNYINHNEFQAITLGGLRDSLLPKLLSGEIHIKDVVES